MWDTYLFVPESFLSQASTLGVELRKGDATKCENYAEITSLIGLAKEASSKAEGSTQMLNDCGGCVVNTAKVLASLGTTTTLIGTRGNDQTGLKFSDQLRAYGVQDFTIPLEEQTGEVLCFVTPDAQRTFAYFAGASSSLGFMQFRQRLEGECGRLEKASFHIDLAYVDCYTFLGPEKSAEKMVEYVKEKQGVVALNTGSVGIVSAQLQRLRSLVETFCDIVIANDEESIVLAESSAAEELTLQEAAQRISSKMSSEVALCIVTAGKEGCYIARRGESLGSVPVSHEDTVMDPVGKPFLLVSLLGNFASIISRSSSLELFNMMRI